MPDIIRDRLPSEIREIMERAETLIGAQRAVIALQGLVTEYRHIRLIDGELRDETVAALEHGLTVDKIETIAERYLRRLTSRFPEAFAEPAVAEEPIVDGPVEAPAPKATRRIR